MSHDKMCSDHSNSFTLDVFLSGNFSVELISVIRFEMGSMLPTD